MNISPAHAQSSGRQFQVATWGNDATGDGSPNKPFATVGRASRATRPGDTVLVRGGVYPQAPNIIVANGTAAQPVTIKAYPGEWVGFDAKNVWLESWQDVVTIINSSHVVFEGFEIYHSNARGLGINVSHHITVRRNKIYDIWGRALGGEGSDLTFEYNHIFNAVLQNAWGKMEPGGWAGGIGSWLTHDNKLSRNITYRGNDIHDVWGECLVAVFVDGATITGNKIRNCFSMNVYVDNSRNVKIEKNHIYTTTDQYNRRAGRPAGIGLAVEYYGFAPPAPLENITITNNLIVGTGMGIRFWTDPANAVWENTYRRVQIHHNVVKPVSGEAVSFAPVGSVAERPSANEIRDNVLYAGSAGSALSLGNGGAIAFSSNVWPDGVPRDGQGPGSFATDPVFTDPWSITPEGFRLQAHSPLRGAGVPTGESTDFFGNHRNNTRPSVGLHEGQ